MNRTSHFEILVNNKTFLILYNVICYDADHRVNQCIEFMDLFLFFFF